MATLTKTDPWESVADVPCRLALVLQIPDVKVSDLLTLSAGSVLNTQWNTNRDLPLRVNDKLLGWVEFEGTGQNLKIRLTEFAWEHKG